MAGTIQEHLGVDPDEEFPADLVGAANEGVQSQPVGEIARADDDRSPELQIRIAHDAEIAGIRVGIGCSRNGCKLIIVGFQCAQPRCVGPDGAPHHRSVGQRGGQRNHPGSRQRAEHVQAGMRSPVQHPGTAAMSDLQQTGLLESLERLAHRMAVDL